MRAHTTKERRNGAGLPSPGQMKSMGNEAEMEFSLKRMKWNAEAADGPPAHNQPTIQSKASP